MIANRGNFPFCDAPYINGAEQSIGNYQCGFFDNQANDAFLNIKNYSFQLDAVEDSLDAGIAIEVAMAGALLGAAVGPGGSLAGLTIGLSDFLTSAGSRTSITGTTYRQRYVNEQVTPTMVYDATGKCAVPVYPLTFYWWYAGLNDTGIANGTQTASKDKTTLPWRFLTQGTTVTLSGKPGAPVTASVVTRGTRDIYAQNLCLISIDWGQTVRQMLGTKQTLKSLLFYPKITLLFWASAYIFATDITLLAGAGTIEGGINLTNSVGVISNLNVLTSAGPPIGTPSVFGQIQPNERYDAIGASLKPTTGTILGFEYQSIATLSGITWDRFSNNSSPTIGSSPNQGVFYGSTQCPFSVSQDQSTMTVYLPYSEPQEYLTFKTTAGDVFTTRTPI